MSRRDPFDEIRIFGKVYSIKKIQKLYEKDKGIPPKMIAGGITNIWICPKCNEIHQIYDVKNDTFCSKCGQRIKWPRRKLKDITKQVKKGE